MLPFTHTQFLQVFIAYNDAIWPAQIGAYLLGLAGVVLVLRPSGISNRLIGGILAIMWIWTGILYHWLFFAQINNAAYLFAALFVIQGVYFFFSGFIRNEIAFGLRRGVASLVGFAFVIYSGAIYPLAGMLAGLKYPQMPMFGVTPCPVTIYTFGMLLLTTQQFNRGLLAIPFIWSLIGGSAAILLNVPQDWLLLFSGAISIPLLILRDRKQAGVSIRK